jgi:putative salt-induced outer membrane protein YdiY
MLPPCDFERAGNEFKLSRPMGPGIRHDELSVNRPRVIALFYEEFSTPIQGTTEGQAFS